MKSPGTDTDGKQPGRHIWKLSRRGFLVGMAVTGVSLAVGIPAGLPKLRRTVAKIFAGDTAMPGAVLNPLLWIEIFPDNRIRVFVPKTEMGQGTHTGLAQLAAEELEVPLSMLEIIHASTLQAEPKFRGTSGSQSIVSLFKPFRQAAAAMFLMLKKEASIRMKVSPDQLLAGNGEFAIHNNANKRISYGQLVEKKSNWEIPKMPVPMKDYKEFKYIGKPVPRIDIPLKVNGKAVFGFDFRIKGMHYGAVVRPPALEAKMLSIDVKIADKMPGVKKVVIRDNFAGVVAETRLQATNARDAIEVKWDKGRIWQQEELERIITAGGSGGIAVLDEGKADQILSKEKTISADYRTGFGAHAGLEPQVAVAEMFSNGGKIWTSTQSELSVSGFVADALEIKQDNIEVYPLYAGGGFGRKADTPRVSHAAVEAAILSQAAGVPVHVGWTREEEMLHSFYRPMAQYSLSAVLDNNKQINAISIRQAIGNILLESFPSFLSRAIGIDVGAVMGAYIMYNIPNRKLVQWKKKSPVPTGAWRSIGLYPSIFAIESFMDELAHAADADPVRFRLDHLPDNGTGKRMRKVIEKAAEAGRWGSSLPKGRSRGIACCMYSGTCVAEIGEISVNGKTGKISVHNVTAVIDCGYPVNPDEVRSQTEGAVVMGTSAALLEEIIVKDGKIQSDNYDQYPLLTMADAPDVRVILLEAPDKRPRSVGEPPIGPVGAMIGNAFFSLTGKRLRRLPMTMERVKEALEN